MPSEQEEAEMQEKVSLTLPEKRKIICAEWALAKLRLIEKVNGKIYTEYDATSQIRKY